jgi:sugar phosphate isomerase/epimerase
MRLACQSNAWPFTSGLNGLVPVLETIKSLDFQGYETSFRNVQEAFSNPKPARTRLEATGLACTGVHVAAPDQYEAETSIPPLDFLRTIADGSSELGMEYFVLSGRGVGEVNGQLDRDALKRKVAAVLEIAQYCHDVGITLAYHNHVDDFLNGGAEVDELLDTGNGLIKAWLCVHNAEFADVKVADYFSKRHEHIAGIHLTNILQTKPDHHPFDGQSLLTEIEKAAWKGWLIIEEERTRERREWPETSAVTKSRQHVRKIFGI